MKKYYFKCLLSSYFLLLYISFAALCKPEHKTKNVILIIVDDLNDVINTNNSTHKLSAPFLNELANNTLNYHNHYALAPSCNPSRISLFTGLHPITTGIIDNRVYPLRDEYPYITTINNYLKENGYLTIGLGKLLHGKEDDERELWDNYVQLYTKPHPSIIPSNGLTETFINSNYQFDWAYVDKSNNSWGDVNITNFLIDFLEEDRYNKPFFICAGYRMTHLPWYVPTKYDSIMSKNHDLDFLPEILPNDTDDLPPSAFSIGDSQSHLKILASEQWNEACRLYFSSVLFLDDELRRFWGKFKKSPYYNNTLVIITSDHGFMLGEKNKWRKKTLWNKILKIPLVIYNPEYTRNSSINNTSHLDIFPTIIDYCNLPEIPYLPGRSLFKSISQDKYRNYVISIDESMGYSVNYNNWHLIKYFNGDYELYNQKNDPNEWFNLSNEREKYTTINEINKMLYSLVNNNESINYLKFSINITLTDPNINVLNKKKFDRTRIQFFNNNDTTIIKEDIISYNSIIPRNQNYNSIRLRIENPRTQTNWYYFTDNNSEYNLKIYPNPFSKEAVIQLPSDCNSPITNIEVVDLKGNLIERHEVNITFQDQKYILLNSPNIKAGIYFIIIKSSNCFHTSKIIKY